MLRNLVLPALLHHIEQMTGLTARPEVMQVYKSLLYYGEILDIFESAIFENATLQESLAQVGTDFSNPVIASLSNPILESRVPNALKSDPRFRSPWAQSLALEDYFFKVAAEFRVVMQSQLVELFLFRFLLFFQIASRLAHIYVAYYCGSISYNLTIICITGLVTYLIG